MSFCTTGHRLLNNKSIEEALKTQVVLNDMSIGTKNKL